MNKQVQFIVGKNLLNDTPVGEKSIQWNEVSVNLTFVSEIVWDRLSCSRNIITIPMEVLASDIVDKMN
jgi:hypothetical protein